jgi:hypothetical protein
MPTPSDNHGFDLEYRPGERWDYNDEFAALERLVTVRDVVDQLDEYTPHEDALFLATDTGQCYLGTGEEWTELDRTASGPTREHSVTRYGATGDGETDDTGAIQAAIDAADRHERVWFPYPDDRYLISEPIHFGEQDDDGEFVQSNHLCGSGRVPIVAAEGFDGAMFRCDEGEATGAVGVVFHNFDLDANDEATHCLHLGEREDYIADCQISNVQTSAATDHGILLDQPITTGLTNVRAQYHGGDGFRVRGPATSVVFSQCYAVDTAGHGYCLKNAFYCGFYTTACDAAGRKGYYLNGDSDGPIASVAFVNPGVEYPAEESFHFRSCYAVTVVAPNVTGPSDAAPTIRIDDGCRNFTLLSGYLNEDPDEAATVWVSDSEWTYNNLLVSCEIASLGGPGAESNVSLLSTSIDTSSPPGTTETRLGHDLEIGASGAGVVLRDANGEGRYRLFIEDGEIRAGSL